MRERYSGTTEITPLEHPLSLPTISFRLNSLHSLKAVVGVPLCSPLSFRQLSVPAPGLHFRLARGRDHGASPPGSPPQEIAALSGSSDLRTPVPLGMALSLLVAMALGLADREAGNGDRRASKRIPLVLEMEESSRRAWKT